MTETEATGRELPHRHTKTVLAVLTATAALAVGVQALAPNPAAAMINLGNECANLSGQALFECEMRGGGGAEGGSSGGGGGGSAGGGTGDQIIGEAIYVEGTLPPSRCVSCLPNQAGGGRLGFLERGGKHPHRGRGGRPKRGVVEVPIPPRVTLADCKKIKNGRLLLPFEARERAQRAELIHLSFKLKEVLRRREALKAEEATLRAELKTLQLLPAENAMEIARDEQRLGEIWNNLETVESKTASYFALKEAVLDSPAKAEREAMLAACKDLARKPPAF
jgi:hypothetical protein